MTKNKQQIQSITKNKLSGTTMLVIILACWLAFVAYLSIFGGIG